MSGGREATLLESRRIRELMTAEAAALLEYLTVLQETDSTNDAVSRLPERLQHAHAVLADRQSRGKGRRQRSWHSPAGGNLYLSLGWRFDGGAPSLATLPLVVAVCTCRALAELGFDGTGVKWPNDILVDGRKLAGILVELQSVGSGPALAIIGIGLNVAMPGESQPNNRIDRPWTDLATEWPAGAALPGRNRIAAGLLEQLLVGLARFGSDGFTPFAADWQNRDTLRGNEVELEIGNEALRGVARGIDEQGGLLVETADSGLRACHAGEVTLQRG
jgi:BirA family biotin operon repressor/biotin-[acetyl-CoA-carboxylase] ligase